MVIGMRAAASFPGAAGDDSASAPSDDALSAEWGVAAADARATLSALSRDGKPAGPTRERRLALSAASFIRLAAAGFGLSRSPLSTRSCMVDKGPDCRGAVLVSLRSADRSFDRIGSDHCPLANDAARAGDPESRTGTTASVNISAMDNGVTLGRFMIP
jgi:hypothetical protein